MLAVCLGGHPPYASCMPRKNLRNELHLMHFFVVYHLFKFVGKVSKHFTMQEDDNVRMATTNLRKAINHVNHNIIQDSIPIG